MEEDNLQFRYVLEILKDIFCAKNHLIIGDLTALEARGPRSSNLNTFRGDILCRKNKQKLTKLNYIQTK